MRTQNYRAEGGAQGTALFLRGSVLTRYRDGLRSRAESVRAVYTFPEMTLISSRVAIMMICDSRGADSLLS